MGAAVYILPDTVPALSGALLALIPPHLSLPQERLWKQAAAMGVALEVARLRGSFGLRQPPKEWRRYSDEVRRLRDAAAKEAAVAAGKRPSAGALESCGVYDAWELWCRSVCLGVGMLWD